MKGLLIKDWKLLLRNQKSFLVIMSVMMVLYMAIGNPVFVISYTPMLCVFVALSTITYDMFDNGAAFLFSLPFSRKDYVREKYIFSGLITLTAWGISVLVAVGYSVVKGEDWKELLMTAGVLLVMAILLMGVSVPLQLKFGAEKSRVVVILVMAVMFGMVIGFFKGMELYLENGTGLFMEVGDRAAERQTKRGCIVLERMEKRQRGQILPHWWTARVCGKSWKIMII